MAGMNALETAVMETFIARWTPFADELRGQLKLVTDVARDYGGRVFGISFELAPPDPFGDTSGIPGGIKELDGVSARVDGGANPVSSSLNFDENGYITLLVGFANGENLSGIDFDSAGFAIEPRPPRQPRAPEQWPADPPQRRSDPPQRR